MDDKIKKEIEELNEEELNQVSAGAIPHAGPLLKAFSNQQASKLRTKGEISNDGFICKNEEGVQIAGLDRKATGDIYKA